MRRGWCVLPRICDLAAIAGVIAAAGCGAGDAALDARWAGVRDTVNGVEVVRNPATPLFGSAAAPCTCWTGWRGASCAALHFQLLDGRGTPLREVVVDRPPVYPSEAAIEAAIGRMRSTMQRDGIPRAAAERVLSGQRERLRLSPRNRAVRQDPDTRRYALWEQPPAELGGGDATLHLFSADGIYLAELRFDREWVDFDVAGGAVFALVRDPETELAHLTAYRIVLPGAGTPAGGA